MQNSSARCFTIRASETEPPLFQDGHLVLQPHDIGWIVSSVFTLIATTISGWLIYKHLVWYTNGNQQRYIVRLLFMVPIYAIVSLTSYIFYNHSVPLTLIRDSYESFVIYCFFYLLLEYLAPTVESQKDVVRNAKFQKWLFPMGFVDYRPRDGLHFLQLMKWGILQYCIIRPGTTIAAIILDFVGLYCEDSWNFRWGHVYITVLVSVSVTIAMFCLLQFYSTLASELTPHRPLLKFISIKSVVFLTFWQVTLLSVLASFGLLKATPTMTSDAIQNGVATILETVEMSIFAVVHLKAFPYVTYVPQPGTASQRTSLWRSLKHVLDVWELWSELKSGSDYMSKTVRGIEADGSARRRLHFAHLVGRERGESSLKRYENSENNGYISEQRYSQDMRPTKGRYHPRGDENYGILNLNNLAETTAFIDHSSEPTTFGNRHLRVEHDSTSRGVGMTLDATMYRFWSSSGTGTESGHRHSQQSTESQNTRKNRAVVQPTEIYDVPLETDVLASLQKRRDVPNMSEDDSRGTSHFLAARNISAPSLVR